MIENIDGGILEIESVTDFFFFKAEKWSEGEGEEKRRERG